MAPEFRIVIVLAGCALVQPAALAQTPAAGSFMRGLRQRRTLQPARHRDVIVELTHDVFGFTVQATRLVVVVGVLMQ